MFNMIKKDCSFTTEEGYEFGFAQNSIVNPRMVYFEIKKGDKYKGTWMEENDFQYAKEYMIWGGMKLLRMLP